VEEFYRQGDIPVHVNTIYNTCEEAMNCGRGTISLALCRSCGLVFNSEFSDSLLKYNKDYDNDQYCSSYYREYANSLVKILIDRYHIRNRRILEVGCGNGEFLKLFCKESHSKGVGIDPAYRGRKKTDSISFIADYFNEKYFKVKADVLILRHILEHIENPSDFLIYVIHNVDFDAKSTVMIEVPDFEWIFKQGAYWDITYEHCNYFTKESLRHLFELSKIQVNDIFNTFSSQYLVAIGELSKKGASGIKLPAQTYPRKKVISDFTSNVRKRKSRICSITSEIGGPFTIWGIAGKGVTFINMLDEKNQREIPFVIDINKKKQGKYCPGTGHKIEPPTILEQEKDLKCIIVMNPNYYDEISQFLEIYNRKFSLITI
jgi:SAM-dependent methyltransferase